MRANQLRLWFASMAYVLVAALRRVGIAAFPVIALADHAIPSRADYARAARFEVEAWLTSARCAVKLPHAIGGAPVLALSQRIAIGPLIDRLPLDAFPRALASGAVG